MPIADTELRDIESTLTASTDPARAIAALRRQFPALRVTTCDLSDIDLETPFRAWPHLALHLIDSADHCWRLTADAARATGLLVVASHTTRTAR